MKEIVLDTETTGLSVKDGHRIVEIGCIELDDLVPTKNIFHFYLNPERKVSEKAFEVHGYSDQFLSTKQKFGDIGGGDLTSKGAVLGKRQVICQIAIHPIHFIGKGHVATLRGQKGLLFVEKRGVGIDEPIGQDGFAQGEVQSVGLALQHILLEFHQGLVRIVLKDQIGNIPSIVPIIDIKEIFTVEGIVQVKIVAEAWDQCRVAFLIIIFIKEKAERIEVVVFRAVHVPTIVK